MPKVLLEGASGRKYGTMEAIPHDLSYLLFTTGSIRPKGITRPNAHSEHSLAQAWLLWWSPLSLPSTQTCAKPLPPSSNVESSTCSPIREQNQSHGRGLQPVVVSQGPILSQPFVKTGKEDHTPLQYNTMLPTNLVDEPWWFGVFRLNFPLSLNRASHSGIMSLDGGLPLYGCI